MKQRDGIAPSDGEGRGPRRLGEGGRDAFVDTHKCEEITVGTLNQIVAAIPLPRFLKSSDSDHSARVLRGWFWTVVGALGARGTTLIAFAIIARVIGREELGRVGMVQSTIGFFGILAGAGLGRTATKYLAQLRDSDPVKAGDVLGLSALFTLGSGALVAAIFIGGAPWLASATLADPSMATLLRIGTIALLFDAMNGAQVGALSGLEAFKVAARVNAISGVFSLFLLVIGAWLGASAGVLVGLGVSRFFAWALSAYALRRECRKWKIAFNYRCRWSNASVLWKFSLPSLLSNLVNIGAVWTCNALLANTQDGYSELGFFNAANQWRNVVVYLPAMLANVALPMLTNMHARRDRAQYRKALWFNLGLTVSITVFVCIPLGLFSREAMALFGDEFASGGRVLLVLLASAVLSSVNGIVGQVLVSRGEMWTGSIFNCLWAFCMVTAALFFVNHGSGAMALALANLVAYALHGIWQGLYILDLFRPGAIPRGAE